MKYSRSCCLHCRKKSSNKEGDWMEVTEVMNGIDSITGLTESTPAKWIGYIAKGYIQNKEMIQIFVNAGKDIGNYEYDGSEESELRRIIFCEENMKAVAEHMMKCDEFSWLDTLQQCVRYLLSGNEMDAKNKEICEKHFCQIIENENQTLSEQFKDEDGWRISMGSITYLDELRSLCIALENGYWSLEEAEVLIQNIIGYWPVLHGKLDKNATREKTMFSNAGYREFEVRAIEMIRTLSALIDSLTVPLGEKSKADIRNMCNEMKEYGVATSELELYLLKDDEVEAFVADIRTSLGGENENAIIDALRAASVLMKKYPESSAAKKLLNELLNLFHYRKTTGLVSVIWILHNLVYEHSGLITAKIVRELDGNLFTFSQLESYSKEQIAAQKACAALAYRLKLWKPKYCGAGVDAWEKLCSGEIWNEVKNEWLDK